MRRKKGFLSRIQFLNPFIPQKYYSQNWQGRHVLTVRLKGQSLAYSPLYYAPKETLPPPKRRLFCFFEKSYQMVQVSWLVERRTSRCCLLLLRERLKKEAARLNFIKFDKISNNFKYYLNCNPQNIQIPFAIIQYLIENFSRCYVVSDISYLNTFFNLCQEEK